MGGGTLMSKILASAAFAVLGFAAVTPASAGDPRGNWLTENGKAKVAIVNCGGALCGNIVGLKEPNDPATGKPNYTNASLTAAAVRGLVADGFKLDDLACLVCGTSNPDQLMPNHAVMVHGELGAPVCEVASPRRTP